MAFQDDINRILRDHEGYTGDGRGNEGALPVGDRSTGKRPIIKSDLRQAFGLIAETFDEASSIVPRLSRFDAQSIFLFAGESAGSSFNTLYPDTRGVIFLGREAGQLTEEASGAIAIGRAAMQRGRYQHDSIAIGGGALRNLEADSPEYDQANQGGTRHVAIGGNAGALLEKGTRHVLVGRNTGQGLRAGAGAVVVGGNAMAGPAPIGLSGQIETFQTIGSGTDPTYLTVVGDHAANGYAETNLTAVGSYAGESLKTGKNNTLIGQRAGARLQQQLWTNGQPWTDLDLAASYMQAGNTLVLSGFTNPGIEVGDWITFRLLDGDARTFQFDAPWAQVTSVTPNSVTVQSPREFNTSGVATIKGFADDSAATFAADGNVYVGDRAGARVRAGSDSVLTGREAAYNYRSINRSVIIGNRAAFGSIPATDADPSAGCTTEETTAIGHQALYNMTDAVKVTGVGWRTGYNYQSGEKCTFLGWGAGTSMTGGGPIVSMTGSTAVGAGARLSGDYQVQLGDTGTTPYAYAALQVRSDERDKADIEPTALGLDFIERIQPVQYRWDMRDDYVDDVPEDKRADWWSNPVKDGSKKRKRVQQGVIAQQVRDVCEAMGVDFSGLQDHKINGGNDVLTVGYEHFVPPLIRALQEVSGRLKTAEKQIAALRKSKA